MSREKQDGLPEYLYARGQRLWMRYQDETGKWSKKRTPYLIDQVDQAERYVAAAMRAIQDQKTAVSREHAPGMTVRKYADRWLAERLARGVASAHVDRSRLDHALPHVGHMQLDEVRPRHVRDMVRALRQNAKASASHTRAEAARDSGLAPRTIRHVYMTLHNLFTNAEEDELVLKNPVKVKGELPKKVDADPEWRSQATYTVHEVERLISDALIPVERRVQYALKAIAGMRHGEVAALCWRHIDDRAAPLARLNIVQSFCTRERLVKSTKTGETRAVPVHPTLAKILAVWGLTHWERIYGRPPTGDDFVVPTRTLRCVDATDAGEAMKRDLRALELRVEAGTLRDRGGHDLRSWYKTRCIEDGADSLIIRRTTHAPPKDVDGGYERFSWATICREVGKLQVSILDGEALSLGTSWEHAAKKAGARWTSVVTPMGLEPMFSA